MKFTGDPAVGLRGLGRSAFRKGTLASGSIVYAIEILGRNLTTDERCEVMRGWDAERKECCE